MARSSKNTNTPETDDRVELALAIETIAKTKNISKESLLDAIKMSLQTACRNHFGKSDNARVEIDPVTCEYHIYLDKQVVEKAEDEILQISLADAKMRDAGLSVGDIYSEEVKSREFGRIAAQNAKNVILQRIREEERKVIFDQFSEKSKSIVTGTVQRHAGRNVIINLGRADGILSENEMIRGEHLEPNQRVRVFVTDVRYNNKGPRIMVSRTHPELVRHLFEEEVAEVREGIVEIVSLAREAGSRTKMAVWSNDDDVDPVGACVGVNGSRVNAVVDELGGEKIDIIKWDSNVAVLIENALSPSKVVSVIADEEEKSAKVVVPDKQLSLAIGREGQNARLAAKLTGFKIDIKSETQAIEAGWIVNYEDYDEYEDEGFYDEQGYYHHYEYDENGEFLGEFADLYDDDGNVVDSYRVEEALGDEGTLPEDFTQELLLESPDAEAEREAVDDAESAAEDGGAEDTDDSEDEPAAATDIPDTADE